MLAKATSKTQLTSIAVPIAFFAVFPICMLVLFHFRSKGLREKQLTLRAMVEKGVAIPPELLVTQDSITTMEKDRKKGLLFTLFSLGLIAFLGLSESSPDRMWSVGLMPLFLGIGYLINWRLSLKKQQLN